MRLYDTAGVEHSQITTANGTTNQQLPRHYLVLADGYIFIYDTSDTSSLDVLVSLKKDIDKNKDKKEVAIVVIGNVVKESLSDAAVDSVLSKATQWCAREKLRHFTVSAMKRTSLFEPFVYLTSKLTPPASKSGFTPLSMGRKVIKDSS